MNHERMAIPKAAADEVPPGLTNRDLQKHFGIDYYRAKLWVFHTGYQVKLDYRGRGRPALELPTQSAEDVPGGLCQYELQDLLKLGRNQMKRWCKLTGYQPIDGRSKYCGPRVPERQHRYFEVLTAGANKSLEEVGKELGITRERVRQLYVKLKIPRKKFPNTSWKNEGLVNKIRGLALEAKSILSIAEALDISYLTVARILKIHNIPFKNWVQKRLEQELATGIRICTSCRTPKPLTDYYKQHDGRLGKLGSCKDCVNLKARKLRANKGAPVRLDKKAYWDRLKRGRGQVVEEPKPKKVKPDEERVVKRINKIIVNNPAFGLTADQINKLKENKL